MQAARLPLAELNRQTLADCLPLNSPMSVTVEPSSLCNFRCVYCAHSAGIKNFTAAHFKPSLMTWDIFAETINQLKQFPKKSKRLHLFRNGEPLLNPLLPEMIAHISQSEITEHINIITNASLLTPELSLRLVESGLNTLCVSLQGLNDAAYREVGGAGVSFENIYENIKFLREHKKTCNLFVKIADIAIGDENEPVFFNRFSGIADRLNIESICPVYPGVDYTNIIKTHGVNRHSEPLVVPRVCQIPFYHLHILADGSVYYCNSIDSPVPAHNISAKNLAEIWKSEERSAFLRNLLTGCRETYPVCVNCYRFAQEMRPEDNLDSAADKILSRLETA